MGTLSLRWKSTGRGARTRGLCCALSPSAAGRTGLPCPLSLPADREGREGPGSWPRGNGRRAPFSGGVGAAVRRCLRERLQPRSGARARPRRPLRRALRHRACGRGARGAAGGARRAGPGRHRQTRARLCPQSRAPAPRSAARERDIGDLFTASLRDRWWSAEGARQLSELFLLFVRCSTHRH